MKSHLPPKQSLSKSTIKAMREYVDQESIGVTRRLFKLFAIVLNDKYGFGAKRLMNLNRYIQENLNQAKDDEAFWMHIDRRVSQIGLDFPNEDYEVFDK